MGSDAERLHLPGACALTCRCRWPIVIKSERTHVKELAPHTGAQLWARLDRVPFGDIVCFPSSNDKRVVIARALPDEGDYGHKFDDVGLTDAELAVLDGLVFPDPIDFRNSALVSQWWKLPLTTSVTSLAERSAPVAPGVRFEEVFNALLRLSRREGWILGFEREPGVEITGSGYSCFNRISPPEEDIGFREPLSCEATVGKALVAAFVDATALLGSPATG